MARWTWWSVVCVLCCRMQRVQARKQVERHCLCRRSVCMYDRASEWVDVEYARFHVCMWQWVGANYTTLAKDATARNDRCTVMTIKCVQNYSTIGLDANASSRCKQTDIQTNRNREAMRMREETVRAPQQKKCNGNAMIQHIHTHKDRGENGRRLPLQPSSCLFSLSLSHSLPHFFAFYF